MNSILNLSAKVIDSMLRLAHLGQSRLKQQKTPHADPLPESNFVKVDGNNGNVYEVDLDNFNCTCPHFQYRLKECNTPCKHMEKVANQLTTPQLPPRTQ